MVWRKQHDKQRTTDHGPRTRKMIWPLAKKEFRLLARDRISAGILVGMPLLFILLLGLLLGEGFGQKPDDRLRVSYVDLDRGRGEASRKAQPFPPGRWADIVKQDLLQTSGIRV